MRRNPSKFYVDFATAHRCRNLLWNHAQKKPYSWAGSKTLTRSHGLASIGLAPCQRIEGTFVPVVPIGSLPVDRRLPLLAMSLDTCERLRLTEVRGTARAETR